MTDLLEPIKAEDVRTGPQLCPDLWRRCHLTTEDGPIVRAPFKTRPIKERYCYNCAGQGHFGHQCHMKKGDNPELADDPKDILAAPATPNQYDRLKAAILARKTQSERCRFQHPLNMEEHGNQRPTQLLRRMRQLGEALPGVTGVTAYQMTRAVADQGEIGEGSDPTPADLVARAANVCDTVAQRLVLADHGLQGQGPWPQMPVPSYTATTTGRSVADILASLVAFKLTTGASDDYVLARALTVAFQTSAARWWRIVASFPTREDYRRKFFPVPDYPDIIDLEGDDLYFDAVERLPPVQAAEDLQLADALENPPLLDILDNELHVDDQAEENGDQGTDGGQHNTPPANNADLLDDDQPPVILLPPDDVTPTDLPVDVPQQAEPEKRYILRPRETLRRPRGIAIECP
ncbi:hypothetical protein HPB47_023505 [Ixodes persulcatus]|uniref:Uncharacterized protein n=1 Tax=Ixodes persulcatus TaxID=34615 RepID=A0AC60Q939_IXOPE|nr:hypothetical protein HPB47_023505 [Ixodes persulcatus]